MSSKVRNAIRALALQGSVQVLAATVSEVDETERTISARLAEELELANIRLTATISEDSKTFIVNYPKIGSDILIAEMEDGSWFVVMASEIQKTHYKGDNFELIIEDGKVDVKANQLEINGGENKGLVKVEPLAEALEKISAWMRNIDFVLRNTAIVTTAPGSPDALQIALKAAVAASQVPKIPNLENTKVKH